MQYVGTFHLDKSLHIPYMLLLILFCCLKVFPDSKASTSIILPSAAKVMEKFVSESIPHEGGIAVWVLLLWVDVGSLDRSVKKRFPGNQSLLTFSQ